MFRLIWIAAIHTRLFLRTWMPSNIALDLIRSRRGLKFGIPAMLLAAPYLGIAYWCTTLIDAGGPGWLHLVVLVCIWSALKFLIMGPVSLVMLAGVRIREHQQARRDRENTEALQSVAQPGQTRCAPTGHEALPRDEYGATHLGRTPSALGA